MKKLNYLPISLLIVLSSCYRYSLTEEYLRTNENFRGQLTLVKYKNMPDLKRYEQEDNIKDTIIRIVPWSEISMIYFNKSSRNYSFFLSSPEDSVKYSTLPLHFLKDEWYSISCLHPNKNEPQCYKLYFTPTENGELKIVEYYFDGGPY